jgi:hypothetical protein
MQATEVVGEDDSGPLGPHAASPRELKQRIEAERRGLPFLIYRDQVGAQRIVELSEDLLRVTVGRGGANEVALSWDGEVSRLHAALERLGGEWTVSDDQLSTNGTYCNDVRLTGRHRLRDLDALRVGRTSIVFRDPRGESRITIVGEELRTLPNLSEAQRRVLLALCRPLVTARRFARPATNREIAAELVLSIDAVKTHMRSLFRQFTIEDLPHNQKRSRLVEVAISSGVISERDLDR